MTSLSRSTTSEGLYVPNLPGFRTNHPLRSGLGAGGLSMIHGIPMMQDTKSMSMNKSRSMASLRRPLPSGTNDFSQSALSHSKSASDMGVPSWIRHNRQVLRFQGFFKEAVHEKDGENFRVRKVTVLYYLEDNTMQISELKFENSGMPQGHFLKRHKLAKNGSEYYSWQDLDLGSTLTVYGKTIMLFSCDKATRDFYDQAGYSVGEDLECPVDPFEASRSQFMQRETGADLSVYRGTMMNPMKQFMEASLGKHIRDPQELSSFLKHDRQVLRFFCVWDTQAAVFGERGHFTLHYFLTDNTVELLEEFVSNSGKDPFPKLLNRCRLPLDHNKAVVPPGSSRVSGGGNDGEFLHWSALRVGCFINVYGRPIELRGCDQFTRQWYHNQDLYQPENIPEEEAPPPVSTIKIPPHNGIGSEEDSRQSCLHLQMKPARRDVAKLLRNDKKKLQFSCSLVNGGPCDQGRRFFITFYMADDTLSVFEPAQKNSGVLGGRFLARKQYSCQSEAGGGQQLRGGYYQPSHFYVGAEVVLSHHRFLIQDVDESTLKLMESMPELFPMSDTRLVMQKVAQRMTEEQRATFQQLPCVNGCVPLQEVKQALRALFADFELSDHEVVTVLRQLDGERRGSIPLTHLIQSLFQQQQQQRPESGRSRPGSRSAARRQQAEEQQVAVVDSVKRAFRNQEGALIQAFRMADVSFSGLLSVDQFQRAICAASTTVGFALQESDVPLLVAAFYPTGVRHIEYDAFVQDLWG